MFEFNIEDGMPIHRTKSKEVNGELVTNKRGGWVRVATGEIIWKLAFKCVTCGIHSEECYCYSNQETMIKDRDENRNSWHCSLDCMVKDMTPEEQRAWVNWQRRSAYRRNHGHPPFVKWWEIDLVIEFVEELGDCDEPWYPEGSDLECPV